MIATVRLDDSLEKKLNDLSKKLHKKRSDVIRDAINYYFSSVENEKKSRIFNAAAKTKEQDLNLYKEFEGTLSDAI